jgi:hypothetical protein
MLKVTIKIAATLLLMSFAAAAVAATDTTGTVAGVWKGQYVCGQGITGLTLSIDSSRNQLQANFSFYPVSNSRNQSRRATTVAANGEYSLLGTYDSDIGEIVLRPNRWIRQPSGYRMAGLKGLLSKDGQTMSGSVVLAGCTQFELKRTSISVDEAQAARDANKPSPKNVRQLSSVRSTDKKCDVLLAWLSRLEVEYPTIDMDKIAATQANQYAANLFLGKYFLTVFDKPYLQMGAKGKKKRVSRKLATSCQRTWIADGRRNAYAYASFLQNAFATPSPQFVSIIETRSAARTWMDRTLAAVESFPSDMENYELVETYAAKGKSELAQLWPGDQAQFETVLRARQRDIAEGILQFWAAKLETLAPTSGNAAIILQELSARQKYFSQLDPGQVAAIQAMANAKVDDILQPLVDSELAALDSWPRSLKGAAASVTWHQRFRQTFARFWTAGAVRAAESRFITKRGAILDSARNEFAAKIDALPVSAEGGRRARAVLSETLSLASDKNQRAYPYYQDVVVTKLSQIENRKYDTQVASLLSLSNQWLGRGLGVYKLSGLIGAIHQGQIGLVPDDLEQTRPQVGGLFKAMNEECGEGPIDVGFASITYIAPKMDDVMMESLQGYADALQSGDFTKLARQSRVAREGFDDGTRLSGLGCTSAQVRQFRSNLNDLILARHKKAPQPYNQRLFSALLSAKVRAEKGYPDPMSPVAVASSAASESDLLRKYEREIRQTSRSPAQQAQIEKMKRVCNNLMMNMREVCDAAARCGNYFVYFHPDHRRGGYRYYDVFTVSNTPPDAKVQTIQELWSYAEPSKTMGRSQEISRGETIPRNQLKPVLYPQKFGDYYGSQANLCKPYRPGELSCNPNQPFCTER